MSHGKVIHGGAWALVTGAGSGIGRCYALRLAALGYNLVVVGMNSNALEAIRNDLLAAGSAHVRIYTSDLARIEAAEELYRWTQSAGIGIDVLINNAGIFSFCDLLSTSAERVERIILLHDLTLCLLCRLYAIDMVRRGVRGHILNMSSFSLWMPFPGLALYGASKAFIRTFSVAFSKEMQEHGIGVTVICPAGVATNLYGLAPRWQRLGKRLGILISADRCAHRGLRALWRGRRCIVPDWWNRALIPICGTLPMCAIRLLRRLTINYQK